VNENHTESGWCEMERQDGFWVAHELLGVAFRFKSVEDAHRAVLALEKAERARVDDALRLCGERCAVRTEEGWIEEDER